MKSRLPKIFVSLVHCIEAWVPRGVQQLRMACGHEIFMNERGDPTGSPPKSLKYLSTPTSITINALFQVVIKVFPSFDSIIKLADIYNLMCKNLSIVLTKQNTKDVVKFCIHTLYLFIFYHFYNIIIIIIAIFFSLSVHKIDKTHLQYQKTFTTRKTQRR